MKTGRIGAPDCLASSARPGRNGFSAPFSSRVRVPSGKKQQPAAARQPLHGQPDHLEPWEIREKPGKQRAIAQEWVFQQPPSS